MSLQMNMSSALTEQATARQVDIFFSGACVRALCLHALSRLGSSRLGVTRLWAGNVCVCPDGCTPSTRLVTKVVYVTTYTLLPFFRTFVSARIIDPSILQKACASHSCVRVFPVRLSIFLQLRLSFFGRHCTQSISFFGGGHICQFSE